MRPWTGCCHAKRASRRSWPAGTWPMGTTCSYDVSSSYYEGHTCSLMQYGYSRDGKRGRPIVVYGVMADRAGRPVAVLAYPATRETRPRCRVRWIGCAGSSG